MYNFLFSNLDFLQYLYLSNFLILLKKMYVQSLLVCVCLSVLIIWMPWNKPYLGRNRQKVFKTYWFLIYSDKIMGNIRALIWQVEKHPYFCILPIVYSVQSLPLCGLWFPKYQTGVKFRTAVSWDQHKYSSAGCNAGWGAGRWAGYLHDCTSLEQHSLSQSPWQSLGSARIPLWQHRPDFKSGSVFWVICDSM